MVKSRIIIGLLFAGLVAGCSSDDDSARCLRGKSLGYNCCAGVTLVAVQNTFLIGKPYTTNNITYPHVIQVPGSYDEGEFFFRVRDYNPDTDAHAGECFCLIGVPLDVPFYTITATSTFDCP